MKYRDSVKNLSIKKYGSMKLTTSSYFIQIDLIIKTQESNVNKEKLMVSKHSSINMTKI